MQDLIDTIKKSKIPIICICNDKWNQKLQSLRNHCLELDFKRPTALQVWSGTGLVWMPVFSDVPIVPPHPTLSLPHTR